MPVTIDWPNSQVDVPQSYLTALGGDEYELDTLLFWDDLRELEASDDGRAWSRVIDSDPPVTVSGTTLARVVVVKAPYTVSFEDTGSPYRVNLAGTNNNIQERTNLVANVSTASGNSAGLIDASSMGTKVDELHRLQGLESGTPLTVTDAARNAGTITQTVSDDGTTTTVTRT